MTAEEARERLQQALLKKAAQPTCVYCAGTGVV